MQEWQDFSGGEFTEQKCGDEQRGILFLDFEVVALLFDDGVVLVNEPFVQQAQKYALDQVERNAGFICQRTGVHHTNRIEEFHDNLLKRVQAITVI